MNLRNTILALSLLATVAACKPADSNSTTTPAAGEANAQAPAALKEATLSCREIRGLDDISPLFEVSLKLGSESYIVDSISSCAVFNADEYAAHEIPKDAVAACGGWWAGAGDYIYVKYEGEEAVVMQGWQAEEQEDGGYHYEVKMKMPRK